MISLSLYQDPRLGRIAITPNAYRRLPQPDVQAALCNNAKGDRRKGARSGLEGVRLLSAYRASNGANFWTITEADVLLTTVLMPEDY